MKRIIAIIGAVGIISLAAQAQVLLSGGLSYSQNFDSLASTTGTGTTVPWTDNTTLPGWYASRALTASTAAYGPSAYTSYRTDNANSSGWLYSYGGAGVGLATDRALGSLSSGTPGTNAIGLQIRNDTANVVGNVTISYTGEQWRNGGNASAQTILAFTYATSTTPFTSPISALSSDPAFTPFAALNFVSPTTGATSATLDGNDPLNRTVFSATLLTGVTLNPGDEILFRWYDINDAGNDHGGGIDDLTVTFSVVPEPSCLALVGLGMLTLSLWRRHN